VSDEGGPDVMVHYRVIEGEGGYRFLRDGERVAFTELVGDRGRAATWCRVVAEPRTVEQVFASTGLRGQTIKSENKVSACGWGFE
jgi:cold shock CspA family protein